MVKNPPTNAGDIRDACFIPGFARFPWRRARQPTPVFLPGESHGQRSLEGYSPWSRKESDTTERLTYTHTHTHTHTHIHTKSYYFILILVVGGCAARQDPFNVMGKGG